MAIPTNESPAFFSPRKVNLKIPLNSGLRQAETAGRLKKALGCWFNQILF
jgi:hypothetical protein